MSVTIYEHIRENWADYCRNEFSDVTDKDWNRFVMETFTEWCNENGFDQHGDDDFYGQFCEESEENKALVALYPFDEKTGNIKDNYKDIIYGVED